jgi:SH3-like domain-containing protein
VGTPFHSCSRGGYELFQMTKSITTFAKRREPGPSRGGFGFIAAVLFMAFAAFNPAVLPAMADDSPPIAGSGLPVPRFVSLKSDRVNLRNGPGTDYPTGWVYRRAGLPVEVIKEFETWRQVRDSDGATGWVLQSLLSGRRTGLVLPWERKTGASPPVVPIMASDSEHSGVVANVEAGVIADLHSCDGRWCRVTVDQYTGYIEQKKLWGVYEGETFK